MYKCLIGMVKSHKFGKYSLASWTPEIVALRETPI